MQYHTLKWNNKLNKYRTHNDPIADIGYDIIHVNFNFQFSLFSKNETVHEVNHYVKSEVHFINK